MQAEDVDEKLDHNRHRRKVALSCERNMLEACRRRANMLF